MLAPWPGVPVAAMDVQAETRTLLISIYCASSEHVPLGRGRLVSWEKTSGISDVCVGPNSSRRRPALLLLISGSQPQVGAMGAAISPNGFPSFDGGFERASSGTKVRGISDDRADSVIRWKWGSN